MTLASISDLHIRSLGDAGHQCLEAFLAHPSVRAATHVAFLGDIFDLLAGDQQCYLDRWAPIWTRLASLSQQGAQLLYAEGNHDMHLGALFDRLTKRWPELVLKRIPEMHRVEVAGRRIALGHGDEFNAQDVSYLRYKRFIKAAPLRIVADYLMPLAVLDGIGARASKRSRAMGMRRFNEELIREQFRRGVAEQSGATADVVIGGHSHIEDHWHFGPGAVYLNNGYPPKSRKFCYVDDTGGRLLMLPD